MQACIHNMEEALANCKRIGYPIMLKASWGGGGKGIRKVLLPALHQNIAVLAFRVSCPPRSTSLKSSVLVQVSLSVL